MEIEGYKILREISRGPVTTVYLAEQNALERQVLLKVLNVQWKNERDLIERFRREAKISARLRHPNIVNIYDFGISGEHFFISMEYITGMTLSRFIRERHPLPAQAVLFIMREILNGLQYAHKRGVIHRDIKPSNILIEESGTVKIADFGMATITDIPGLTEQGSAVGSPAYMSPEQAMGKKIAPNSDIFSLAVTVYEMFTGRSPFVGANVAESIHKTLNEHPPDLHTIRDDVPRWLSDMIASMLEKDPARRPADCLTLLNRLNGTARLIGLEDFTVYLQNPQQMAFPPLTEQESKAQEPRGHSSKKTMWYALAGLVLLLTVYFIWKKEPVPGNSHSPRPVDTVAVKETRSDSLTEPVLPEMKETLSETQSPGNGTPRKAVKKDVPRERVEIPPSESLMQNDTTPARLFVVCTPWADVYIDGKKTDTTPLEQAIVLQPGRYLVQLKNPAFQDYQTELDLQPALQETLRVTLQGADGYLNLRVHPWARVYVDGAYRETTPLSAPLTLSPGRHTIRLENPAFAPIEDTVWIEAGKTMQKNWRFQK